MRSATTSKFWSRGRKEALHKEAEEVKSPPVKPGELKDHELNLQQTEEVKARISKTVKKVLMLKKLRSVTLNWKHNKGNE